MPPRRSYLLWTGLSLLFLAVFVLPVVRPAWFTTPLFEPGPARALVASGHGETFDLPLVTHHGFVRGGFRLALLALVPLGAWLALRGTQLTAREKPAAWLLALAAAGIGEVVQFAIVDHGHYFGAQYFADNTVWQFFLHQKILSLDPAHLPHSYRFLPDAIVAVYTWLTGSFVFARIAYRLLFDALLYVAVYRFARVYVSSFFAAGAILLLAALYPISILKYAGQFADPMSHLSFAVCFFCLARRYEPGFAPSVFLGILAKESVIVMPLCRAFGLGPLRRAIRLAAIYLAGGVAVALAIRIAVNPGHVAYMVNHVHPGHARANLGLYREWAPLYLASLGVLLPGAMLGWRLMDRPFRLTCLLVTAALVVSSILYSWLAEVRNLVPAFIPLVVINLRYLESVFGRPESAAPATGPLT